MKTCKHGTPYNFLNQNICCRCRYAARPKPEERVEDVVNFIDKKSEYYMLVETI